MHKIPIIPPTKTTTGLFDIAKAAKTESIEKTISIDSIEITVLQNNERWCFLVLEFFFLWASFFAASFLATCAGWRTS